jgi:hypothetical protein
MLRPGSKARRCNATTRSRISLATACTSPTRADPGSAAPTRTPTGCRVSTSRSERTFASTRRTTWRALRRVSTPDLATKCCDGRSNRPSPKGQHSTVVDTSDPARATPFGKHWQSSVLSAMGNHWFGGGGLGWVSRRPRWRPFAEPRAGSSRLPRPRVDESVTHPGFSRLTHNPSALTAGRR